MRDPALVPELEVSDWERSTQFYCAVLGFTILYSRPEERFAYLTLGSAHIMLEQPAGNSRPYAGAELAYPYGRGMNLQIEVTNVSTMYDVVNRASAAIHRELEDRWYRRNERLRGNRQFVVQDPDGYLLRFYQDLGERPA